MARELPFKAKIMALPVRAAEPWVLITYQRESATVYSWEILRRPDAEWRIEELCVLPWILWTGFVEITDSQRDVFLHHHKILETREAIRADEIEAERRLARHRRVTATLTRNASGRERRKVSETPEPLSIRK